MLATTFVVDPAGDDAGSGAPAAPWRSVQRAARTAVAGDTVLVQPGLYVESVFLSHSGETGRPISLYAAAGAVLASPDASASLEAINIGAGVGHIVLDGFEATGGFAETIFVRDGAHHIEIRHCDLHHNRAGIILENAHDILVDGCMLHDNRISGLRIAGTSQDVNVRNTDSYRNGTTECSSGVDGFTAEAQTARIAFDASRAFENGGDGFDLLGDQLVLDGIESRNNACTGVKLWQSASLRNSLITGNRRAVGVTTLSGGNLVSIDNCTLAFNDGVGVDLTFGVDTTAAYTAEIRNSIIIGAFKAIQYTRAAQLLESHNILARPTLYDPVIQLVGGRGTSGHDINIGRWRSRSRQGEGTLAVDPLFADADNDNFEVVPDSAAVGRGQTKDAEPCNIGAYQQPLATTNHAPHADAGPERNGRVNRTLVFTAKGSLDPDGDALSYTWDFGDGSAPLHTYKARHKYTVAGTYTVTLTVSDGNLTAARTISVKVS